MKISTPKLLFYATTWGYVLINFLIAWIAVLSLPLMAIREIWMVFLVVFLIKRKRYYVILFLSIVGVYGAIPFVYGINGFKDILGFIYGFRDIFLIVLIVEILRTQDYLSISNREIKLFVLFVILVSFFDVITTNLMGMDLMSSLFRLEYYYENKGIRINLQNGLFGDRIGSPLYSPNLLCTLLALIFFLDSRLKLLNGFWRLISLIVSIFTMTKVLVLSLGFYFCGKRWKLASIAGLLFIYPFYLFIYSIYIELPPGILKYHLASLIGHFHAFGYALEKGFLSIIPEALGSNSIMMKVTTGKTGAGIESSILARLSELKIFYTFIIGYFVYGFVTIKSDIGRKILAFTIILMLLTATSNQPVAYVPLLFVVNNYRSKGIH